MHISLNWLELKWKIGLLEVSGHGLLGVILISSHHLLNINVRVYLPCHSLSHFYCFNVSPSSSYASSLSHICSV